MYYSHTTVSGCCLACALHSRRYYDIMCRCGFCALTFWCVMALGLHNALHIIEISTCSRTHRSIIIPL